MSVTHQARVLELDSQIELLERLQLLTHFTSNFVTVSGASGAGKTWLAQRFLETWAQDKNQALLMCHPNQTDEQRRTTILTQLLSEPLFNPADSLVESFTRNMEHETCDIVIVVDDAHLLNESLLSELWLLLMQAQHRNRWRINIVLFTRVASLDALFRRLSHGQEIKPIELEIEPLSSQEAERFLEQLVMRYVEDDMERRVRNAYRTVARRPGEIMALLDQKVEKKIVIRSIIGSPLNIALVVLLLLAMIGGGYWWMMGQPTPDQTAQQITGELEQTVIPTLEQPQASSAADASIDGESQSVAEQQPVVLDPSFIGAEDDSTALPPEVVEKPESVGVIDDDSQRVVITSEVIDAIIENESDPADTVDVEQLVDDSRQETPVESSANVFTPITFELAKEKLNSYSPRSYTLQLAAVNSRLEVQNFLNRYELNGKVMVYSTLRDGIEWFIITYQNYPTIQVARDAVDSLPKPIQQLGPWAKSLNQVQREIARSN
ncbi:NACHT domain-containing protein [Vibrio ponticus]|uniref:NACHT domain-containing protein n=1 Tax=Vibrio ponticus TaxID=265668 RepID=A0A3N3E6K7_9VIBR|nr:AAA family ATPase [Vibrio ponticus]ROV62365.1 NACHT domain-containing protein [Vibrio ponticus]